MKYLSFLILLLLTSCTEKLDIDQAKQLQITPVFEGDIFYLDLSDTNLIDQNSNFRTVVQDTVSFGIFEDGKTRDGFEKAEITVGYDNTFQRNFEIDYFFLDENEQIVEQNNFTIQAATTSLQNVTGEEIFVFDKTTNPDFIHFRKIAVKITITPNTLPVETGQLHIQTKGKFYTSVIIE